jgi:hypothetical protein
MVLSINQRPTRRRTMYNVQINATARRLIRKVYAAVAIGAAAVAFIAAAPARQAGWPIAGGGDRLRLGV